MTELHPLNRCTLMPCTHLQALIDLAWVHSHEDFCELAERIVNIVAKDGDLR
jgi:hypothetical protein